MTPAAYDHPWFSDRVEGALPEPAPELLHGTAVVGLVLQRAPGARVIVESVEAPQGAADVSTWAAAVDRAARRSAQVVLLPFGSDEPSPALENPIQELVSAGIAVVAAAGNQGRSDAVGYPASVDGVVAVGGVGWRAETKTWEPAAFTNRGPRVDVYAPAVDVLTTTLSASGRKSGPTVSRISGTSMSAALVAGAIAAEISNSGEKPRDAAGRVAKLPPEAFVRGLPWDPGAEPASPPDAPSVAVTDREAKGQEGVGWELADARTVANDSATADDRLGYDIYRDAILTFLRDPRTRPPLTVGIKGRWGTGKTSLMEMIQQSLDPPVELVDDSNAPRSIPLSEDSQRKLVEYAGGGRPRIARVLRLLRRSDDTLVHPAKGASGGRTTGLQVSPPDGTDGLNWRPTIWFNPWMYQTGDQVWAGLAHELIRQVTQRMNRQDRERFWLALNLRRIDREAMRHRLYVLAVERLLPSTVALVIAVVLALAGAALAEVLGAVRATAVIQGLGGTTAVVAMLAGLARVAALVRAPTADVLPALVSPPDTTKASLAAGRSISGGLLSDPGYAARLGFFHLVHSDVTAVLDLVATPERPLVVFVDDLDRCSEGTVAQVIEALNLFVAGQFRNCVFVVAMEPEAVAASIEAAYDKLAASDRATAIPGTASMGWRFLDKLVQLPISVPALDPILAAGLVRTQIVGPPQQAIESTSATERSKDFQTEVEAYESLLSSNSPSFDDLNASTQALTDSAPGVDPRAVQEAARRVARQRLRPEDPQVAAIVTNALEDLAWNPREIKRFVNLLRFYALVAQEREFRDPHHHQLPLDLLSRMALLAIRWPHLRSQFVERLDGQHSVLAVAESLLGEDALITDDLGAALARRGIAGPVAKALIEDEALRDFLSRGQPLASEATGYL